MSVSFISFPHTISQRPLHIKILNLVAFVPRLGPISQEGVARAPNSQKWTRNGHEETDLDE
jgi:hypothetical protein